MKQRLIYWREYRKRPEVIKRNKEYERSPKRKQRLKELSQTIKYKRKAKEWRERNKDYIKLKLKEYAKDNKERIRQRRKEYNKKNKEIIKQRSKEYNKKNKERLKKYRKAYYKKPDVRVRIRERENRSRKENKIFLMKRRLRNNLYHAIKNYSKTGKIYKSKKYGINYNAIIEHLKPFPKDIKNYHIDHIIPLSFFNFNNPKEIEWAFESINHQWLIKQKNHSKGNRFIGK